MDPFFRCFVCNKYFASAIILRSHIRKAHTVSDSEKYVSCQYCGAKITPVHLLSHIKRKHSDAKPEEICPHCNFRTQSGISKLRFHMLTVHNDDSLGTTVVRRCPYCGQAFYYKSDFDRHVKVKHEMRLGELIQIFKLQWNYRWTLIFAHSLQACLICSRDGFLSTHHHTGSFGQNLRNNTILHATKWFKTRMSNWPRHNVCWLLCYM